MACTASKVMPQYFAREIIGGEGERRAQHAPGPAVYSAQVDKPEDVDILAAAEELWSGPFDAMKRAFEGSGGFETHKDMSFAQELVMMPPFLKESAALPAVVKGVHTKVFNNPNGRTTSSDPLNLSLSPFSPPVSISASAPAAVPTPPPRPSPQELKDSQPMQGHSGAQTKDPLQSNSNYCKKSLSPRGMPPGSEVFVDKQFQKHVHGKEKKLPQVGVGAHFELVGKHFTIRSLVKEGPAARTGLMKEGDYLVKVDGNAIGGKNMYDLSKKLLGAEGSKVQLHLQRAVDGTSYSVNITRKTMICQQPAGLGNMNNRRNTMAQLGATLRDTNSVVVL